MGYVSLLMAIKGYFAHVYCDGLSQATKVDIQDIERVYELFVDVDRSREYLAASSSHEFISNEASMDVEKS